MKIAAILGVAMSLAVSGVAQAAPPPPICQGGILADAVTGRPVLGPNREPVPCGAPVVDSGINPLYVVGGLAVVGLGVGLAVGLSGGKGCNTSLVPISGGAVPICN